MKVSHCRGMRAFSLVEVTLALGVAAFCLVSVFALVPTAFNIQAESIGETGSIVIAAAIESDLRATPNGASNSPQFSIPIGTTTTLYFSNEGRSSVSLNGESRYRSTITFPPNPAGPRGATFATVQITWPAPASPDRASGSRSSFVALDRN
jgi:uncharacterized protein (TIGR02598 family)